MSMTPEVLATTKDELNAFERTPESQRKAAGFGTLGQIPLVVIRRQAASTLPRREWMKRPGQSRRKSC